MAGPDWPGPRGGDGPVTPLGQAAWRDVELAAKGIGGLAARDAQDDFVLPSAAPSSTVPPAGLSCDRASPSLRTYPTDAVPPHRGRRCPHVSTIGASREVVHRPTSMSWT